MISLPNPTNKMTLSQDQLSKIVQLYAERVVDNMDVRDLCAFAIDTICDSMIDYNESELMEELSHYYEDDELEELVESVTQDAQSVWIKVSILESGPIVWATLPKPQKWLKLSSTKASTWLVILSLISLSLSSLPSLTSTPEMTGKFISSTV